MAEQIQSGDEHNQEDYLEGKLLIAMPTMADDRFEKSLVYLCAHNEEGAMGLIVNKIQPDIAVEELFSQFEIPVADGMGQSLALCVGGPVEQARGFVLHSADYHHEVSMPITEHISLTATIDVLRKIAQGNGPEKQLIALGYVGWGPGQLEQEIQENAWLTVDADDELIFGNNFAGKWERAMMKLGFNPANLSTEVGHA